jgi:alpha-1,3-rhamnosyl/mannosyltransferase
VTEIRVGVNLLWLAPGEVGGSEDYCIGLLRALAAQPEARPDVRVVVYANREVARCYPDLRDAFEVVVAPTDGRRRVSRIAIEHTWLAVRTWRDRMDVVHHLGGTMPFVRTAPGMVLVHDLQPWAIPENFSRGRRWYLRVTVPPTVRRARAVTTLSRWVQHDVHARLGVPLERMACLPPGAARLAGVDRRADQEVDVDVLARLDIGERPFFLYPVITYAHKNHETLIRAFKPVTVRHPDALLVLPGGEGPAEENVRAVIRDVGVERNVRRLGRVSDAILQCLYRTTTALTFPSRYEGFGMSVLEVMDEGRPVVASTACALPEVVGDGGVLVDPDDVGGWTDVMQRLLDDDAHWRVLADAARARAKTFDWSSTVEGLVATYRRAAVGPLDRSAVG